MSEENREKEIEKLIKGSVHTGYPFKTSSWNDKIWEYYSVFYEVQCDYNKYPEVLELFSLGVKPLVLPMHGSVTDKHLWLLFGSNQPEQGNERVNALFQKLKGRLEIKYPGFSFEPTVWSDEAVQ